MMDFDSILSGAICIDVFLQPTNNIFGTDTFVINFLKGDSALSFHSFSLVRLVSGGRVIYTVTDHYLNNRGIAWKNGQQKLSSSTYPKLKDAVIGKAIVHFSRSECGDVRMEFDNAAVLEFLIDTSKTMENNEAHRLLLMKKGRHTEPKHYVFSK